MWSQVAQLHNLTVPFNSCYFSVFVFCVIWKIVQKLPCQTVVRVKWTVNCKALKTVPDMCKHHYSKWTIIINKLSSCMRKSDLLWWDVLILFGFLSLTVVVEKSTTLILHFSYQNSRNALFLMTFFILT